MKSLYRYSVLAVLALLIIAMLGSTFSGPLIYSLKTDLFPSVFHENTDALKVEAFNSTLNLLPLMQDILDYTGPIVMNINIRDMDQARYYLDQLSHRNIQLKNLVINLEMTDSEVEEFSSNKQLQQDLLHELMNSTISLDELDSLMIRYRNDQNMLVSIELQREALRKKIHEIIDEYKAESVKVQTLSEKLGLDDTQEKESVKELETLVTTTDEKNQQEEIQIPQIPQVPRIPTLSLLVNPDTGKYGDRIGLSGVYRSSTGTNGRYPVSIYIENDAPVSTSTDEGGIYKTGFTIEKISPGEHTLHAVSGLTTSESRILNVTPVDSTTSLDIQPVYNLVILPVSSLVNPPGNNLVNPPGDNLDINLVFNKPEVVCYGTVLTGELPVRNAPVNLISDYHTILRQTSGDTGSYQTHFVLSPGMHQFQVQFVNATYPLFSSKSQVYQVEAGRDSILSIRLLDQNMSADELSLTVDPATATYKDVIDITGVLSGKDPKDKTLDVFIDGTFSHRLQTRPDGSYAEKFLIEKMKTTTHMVFTRYSEPEVGEIYSESRPITITAADSATSLDIEMTDGGTGLICTGNVTTRVHGVSSAPVELVWDDRNIIKTDTDTTGSFRQKISLPAGNHSIFARFTSRDWPVKPSQSSTSMVTVYPPTKLSITPQLSLVVRPASGIYHDKLTFGGTLISPEHGEGSAVDIFIDNNYVSTEKTGHAGYFSSPMTIERISAGQHRAIAHSGNLSSDNVTFQVLPVLSQTSLMINAVNQSALYECTGSVMAFDPPGGVIQKPVTVHDAEAILKLFWKNSRNQANRPVISAPVRIVSNTIILLETTTDTEGRFSELMSLPEGQNVIVAQFVNDSYPIFSSQSQRTIVDTPSANLTLAEENGQSTVRILEPLAAVAILLLFTAGAGYYLKRNSILFKDKWAPLESVTEPELPHDGDRSMVPASSGETRVPDAFPHPDHVVQDPIFARYLRILHAEGLSPAARTVYVYFTGTIAQTLHICSHKALTPREFLQACEKKPFMAPVSSFIALYEQIRYGGARSPEKQGEFEESIRTTDESLEGEHH